MFNPLRDLIKVIYKLSEEVRVGNLATREEYISHLKAEIDELQDQVLQLQTLLFRQARIIHDEVAPARDNATSTPGQIRPGSNTWRFQRKLFEDKFKARPPELERVEKNWQDAIQKEEADAIK